MPLGALPTPCGANLGLISIMNHTVAQAAHRAKTPVRFRTVDWQDRAQAANILSVSSTDAPTRSILLLDDDPDVGIAAQLLLQRRVAPVTCLRRPAEVFAALDRLHPALLLLDLNFGPGRTDGAQGLRLLEEICARARPPVIVVLTAYADIDLAVQALKRGAFDFIVKPWDNVRLIAASREALRNATPALGEQAPQSPTSVEPVRSLAAQERAAVTAAMTEAQGNLSAAARALGLSRAALYRRLQKYGF
jgi:two-component system, response regulator RegA